MSINPNFLNSLEKKAKNNKELEDVKKVRKYLSNMTYESMGYCKLPNVYRQRDVIGKTAMPKEGRDILCRIYEVTDRNDKYLTGRRDNTSAGARECFGATISYVLVPQEENKNGIVNFENIADQNKASPIFDPRYVALSTYPQNISDIAGLARDTEYGKFFNEYCGLSFAGSPCEMGPRYLASCCESIAEASGLVHNNQEQN